MATEDTATDTTPVQPPGGTTDTTGGAEPAGAGAVVLDVAALATAKEYLAAHPAIRNATVHACLAYADYVGNGNTPEDEFDYLPELATEVGEVEAAATAIMLNYLGLAGANAAATDKILVVPTDDDEDNPPADEGTTAADGGADVAAAGGATPTAPEPDPEPEPEPEVEAPTEGAATPPPPRHTRKPTPPPPEDEVAPAPAGGEDEGPSFL